MFILVRLGWYKSLLAWLAVVIGENYAAIPCGIEWLSFGVTELSMILHLGDFDISLVILLSLN